MFTKQWYNTLMSMATGVTIENGYIDYNNITQPTVYTENSSYRWYNVSPKYIMSRGAKTTTINEYGVMFGDGDTPATKDDIKLAGSLITTISSSVSITSSNDDTGSTCTGVFTVTNTGSAEITIREVVMYGRCPRNTTGGAYPCVIERTVLDTPVTIPAGGIGQVTYTIRMNYPTA